MSSSWARPAAISTTSTRSSGTSPSYQVVAFTATQIPGIDGRRYPAALAGSLYPDGIPIVAEDELEGLIRRESVDLCVFSYSDVAHTQVMHLASRAIAAGADFLLLGARTGRCSSRRFPSSP